MQPSGAARCPTCASEVRSEWRVCPTCESRLTGQDAETQTTVWSESSPSAAPVDEGRFPAGTVLAERYRIVALLAQGGIGEVYRAHDVVLNQAVALKFLSAANMNEASLVRFRNEVRVARQVTHPNVCRVYDIGFADGHHFLSMEYLDGEDLASLLRRIGRLPQDKAIEFARQMCSALAAAHERGVLHRDLKPANIMIDGRGRVRITDFGLAALAAEIPRADLRSGTPAYMSPEQKAGRELSARSDLYSLGLVLYEMFTGRRRSETQSDPAELVKDLDPAIERVILQCLEEDPRRRPRSARSLSLALPGTDPVAAALAAGETPSPDMVAASREKEGFSSRTAIACLAVVVIALAVDALIAPKTTLGGRAPLGLPPDAMAFKAQEILRELGYPEPPRRTAYSFECCTPNFPGFLDRYTLAQRNAILASHQPPILYFWYRQHRADFLADQFLPVMGPRRMVPLPRNATVTLDSPANTEPGMVRMILDAKGRLVRLEVRPWETAARTAGDGSGLLRLAGLDAARFQQAVPREIPPMAFDSALAWTGTYSPDRPEPVRVEAAFWKGRPVFLDVGEFKDSEADQTVRPGFAIWIALFVGALTASALTARRNLKLGRGDRAGAGKLAGAWFVIAMGVWAATAQHVARPWEFALLLMALSWALATAGALWLYYIALEPYLRRNWPDSLISWTRFQTGRFRNPLVASHILAGITAALGFEWLVHHPLRALISAAPEASAPAMLATFSQFMLDRIYVGFAVIYMAFAFLLVVVLLRAAVRKLWLADLAACIAFGLGATGLFGSDTYRSMGAAVFVTLITAVWLTLFRRFGLLSLLTCFSVVGTARNSPLVFNAWYGGFTLVVALLLTGLAVWCVWVIVSANENGRSIETVS
jgi:serine/threonine-protein kinase